MPRYKERGWIALHMFVIICMLMRNMWPQQYLHSDQINDQFCFLIWILFAINAGLLAIAIAAWWNIDLFKFLGLAGQSIQKRVRKKSLKERMQERESDKL